MVFIPEAVEEQKEMFSSTDFRGAKERMLSFRVSEALYSVLEAQTENWKAPNLSETARTILSMYFLPVIYEFEWREKKPEELSEALQEHKEKGFSLELSRLNKFLFEIGGYMMFLEEAEEKSSTSLKYIHETRLKIASIMHEMKEKMERVFYEK